MLMGGLICNKTAVPEINEWIAQIRLPELPNGELKWGSVSRSKLEAYRRIVDSFFGAACFWGADFHTIVIDTWGQDHQAFGDGDRDKTFNKELYQLATKFARLYPERLFHLYPDERETAHRPGELRDILNFGRRKNRDKRDFPFRRCHFRNSKHTPLLQVVDILLGALAYKVNGHDKVEGASIAKAELANYVMMMAGIKEPMRDTAMSGKYTVWHRQLQPRKSGRRPSALDR